MPAIDQFDGSPRNAPPANLTHAILLQSLTSVPAGKQATCERQGLNRGTGLQLSWWWWVGGTAARRAGLGINLCSASSHTES